MLQRLLVLDYGSNSLRWLIVDRLEGAPLSVLRTGGTTTRLGTSGTDGRIDPAAVERSLKATEAALEQAEGVTKIIALATHFARSLPGVELLTEQLLERHGLKLHILSEQNEAYLTRMGVEEGLRDLGREPKPVLSFDVGGGSTEFSWWLGPGLAHRSLPLGAISLTTRFLTTESPTSAERKGLREYLREQLDSLPLPEDAPLVASGGTATTLALLDSGLSEYRPLLIQGTVLKRDKLERLVDELAESSLEERRQRLTPDSKRAEIIVAGAEVILAVMKITGVTELLVSDYDLKHGAALVLNKDNPAILDS